MAAGARLHPDTPRSSVSTAYALDHVLPSSSERATTNRAPLSGRGDHHTAAVTPPECAARTDDAQAGAGSDAERTTSASASVTVSPMAVIVVMGDAAVMERSR